MARVLLIANDVIGETMAGPGIRYVEIARVLSKEHTVTVAAPKPSSFKDGAFNCITYNQGSPKTLIPAIAQHSVVIAQSLHPTLLRAVRAHNTRFVADMYDPIVLENLEAQRGWELDAQERQHDFFLTIMNTQLATADHILCASDRQRDYWLGAMTALGRITPDEYRHDPSLERLISLLPFGYASEPPAVTDRHALGEFVPHFNAQKDHVIIWGGGIWNWFDPLSVIEAMARLAAKRNDIKLLFLGTKHPNPNMPEMKMLNDAHALAEKLKVKDSHVFFNEGWVPYDQLANYLKPASIGISTHFNHAETRLSFRTRILSYIWAGLPIISTKGDAMSDMIEREGLGLTIDYMDVDNLVKAITTLVDNKTIRSEVKKDMERVWPTFTWDELVAPLSWRIANDAFTNQRLSSYQFNQLTARYFGTGMRKVWQQKGLRGLTAKLKRR